MLYITYGGIVMGTRPAGAFCLATSFAWISQYNLLLIL